MILSRKLHFNLHKNTTEMAYKQVGTQLFTVLVVTVFFTHRDIFCTNYTSKSHCHSRLVGTPYAEHLMLHLMCSWMLHTQRNKGAVSLAILVPSSSSYVLPFKWQAKLLGPLVLLLTRPGSPVTWFSTLENNQCLVMRNRTVLCPRCHHVQRSPSRLVSTHFFDMSFPQ